MTKEGLEYLSNFIENVINDNCIVRIVKQNYALKPTKEDFNKLEILPAIPDDDADTIGGFLFSYIGRLPKRNEAIYYNNYSFTVVGKSGNIVTKIKIEKLSEDNQNYKKVEESEE